MQHRSYIQYLKSLRWNVIAPVGLLAIALLAVAWFDLTTGGDAQPRALLGPVGTAVRGTLVVPPTAAPGATRTPRPRPTVAGAPGTADERDATRRADLIRLLGAFNELRGREGSYPSTEGNIQTLCVFEDLDQGCKAGEILGEVPKDPLGEATENGYWYQSDGESVTIYASLEAELPDDVRCQSDYEPFEDKAGLICVKA